MIANCEHCGASLKKFWHRLTPGLVDTLIKAHEVIVAKNENKVTRDELDLGNSAYTNLYKLRYHALLVKNIVAGEWHKGEWIITKRGGQFLRGQTSIPFRVQTFRNKIVAKDERLVDIKKVLGTEPYFEVNFDYDLADQNYLDNVPAVKVTRGKKKKGEYYCSKCNDKMDTKMNVEERAETNSVRITRWRECPSCGHKENIE